jgi:hypothetical protein
MRPWQRGELEELANDDARDGAADVEHFREQERCAPWPMAELVREVEEDMRDGE